MWDLTRIDAILWDRDTGEIPMPDITVFKFYSDTNINNAADELEGMALDSFHVDGTTIEVSRSDMNAMGDSIIAIVKSNGGEIESK